MYSAQGKLALESMRVVGGQSALLVFRQLLPLIREMQPSKGDVSLTGGREGDAAVRLQESE